MSLLNMCVYLEGVIRFKESAERPWDCRASHGHTIAFLCETIRHAVIFGMLRRVNILPSSAATMMGEFIRNAMGGGVVVGGVLLGRHGSQVHSSWTEFLASTIQRLEPHWLRREL